MARRGVVLVTGASSGIGAACARILPVYGYRACSASRSSSEYQVDVTDQASVDRLIEQVIAREGRIDGLVNNAGIALGGAVEETTPAEALRQFETNFFGSFRVCRAVLPYMRQQGSGHIINIGSIGGLLAIPYQGFYSASKFALEGLTEALRLEVKQFGIHAVLVEPGDHRTALTKNRVMAAGAIPDSPYAKRRERAIAQMARDEQGGPDPEGVARVVLKILESKNPRLRHTTGPAIQRAAVYLKRAAPYSLIERVVGMYYS